MVGKQYIADIDILIEEVETKAPSSYQSLVNSENQLILIPILGYV
jgi:hypothetical protein